MAERPSWNSAYQGSPPWDVGRPQPDCVRLAEAAELVGGGHGVCRRRRSEPHSLTAGQSGRSSRRSSSSPWSRNGRRLGSPRLNASEVRASLETKRPDTAKSGTMGCHVVLRVVIRRKNHLE